MTILTKYDRINMDRKINPVLHKVMRQSYCINQLSRWLTSSVLGKHFTLSIVLSHLPSSSLRVNKTKQF